MRYLYKFSIPVPVICLETDCVQEEYWSSKEDITT